MRINQNITAFNAYNNLNNTQNRLSSSLEKLSSGFRINRAADDASGLANSENLRSQIGGLKVATRNAQDAISMVQTAEGAMTEVHTILQRMRDLAVDAGNIAPNDNTARDANQLEIAQLKDELDRIADQTQFGTKRILDGTFAGSGGEVATLTVATAGFSATAGTGTSPGELRLIVDDLWSGSNMTEFGATGDLEDYVGNVTLTFEQAGLDAFSVDVARGASATEIGRAVEAELQSLAEADAAEDAGVATADDSVWSNIGISINVTDNELTLTTANDEENWSDPTAATAPGTGAVFQVGANAGQNESIGIESVFGEDLGNGAAGIVGNWTSIADIELTGEGAVLTQQVDDAVRLIDKAITDVSDNRANLGAFQNRMESLIRNVSVAVENLSAAESRIRDTDMALEMVEFTRNQILSQAGTAMLAQANTVPQSVLSLLG